MNMFYHMVEENDLLPSFRKYDLMENDVKFIEELIVGIARDRDGDQVTKAEDYRVKQIPN